MGYMIQYSPEDNNKYPSKATILGKRMFLRTAGFIFVAILLFMAFRYRHKLIQWLLPGDGYVTAMALENMSDRLHDGVSIRDAVTAFCSEILTDDAS